MIIKTCWWFILLITNDHQWSSSVTINDHQWWSMIIKNINDHRDSTCHISAMVTDINVNPNAGCQWSSRLVVDSSCWSSMTIKWFCKWFIMLFLEQIFEIHISATIVERNLNFFGCSVLITAIIYASNKIHALHCMQDDSSCWSSMTSSMTINACTGTNLW